MVEGDIYFADSSGKAKYKASKDLGYDFTDIRVSRIPELDNNSDYTDGK